MRMQIVMIISRKTVVFYVKSMDPSSNEINKLYYFHFFYDSENKSFF